MKRPSLACAMWVALACAACSRQPGAATPVAAGGAASATAPSGTAVAPPAGTAPVAEAPRYLSDLLQQPDFARALDGLAGARALPAWVRKGGTATPVRMVQVDGTPMLLASACKPHDCPGQRVALLYDAASHAMWGLYAQRPEDASPAIDPADDSHDRLSWLGQPDRQRRALLHEALYPH